MRPSRFMSRLREAKHLYCRKAAQSQQDRLSYRTLIDLVEASSKEESVELASEPWAFDWSYFVSVVLKAVLETFAYKSTGLDSLVARGQSRPASSSPSHVAFTSNVPGILAGRA